MQLNFFLESIVGGGKSSVLEEIRRVKPEWHYHNEPVELWRSWNGVNYLEKFYADPKRYAFPFQKVVLDSYVDVLSSSTAPGVHIYERGPRSSIRVFAKAALADGNMTTEEFDQLVLHHDSLFQHLNSDLTCPNMAIYLRVEPAVAMERLRGRGRVEEEGFSMDYMKQLHKFHEFEYFPFPKSFVVDESVEVLSVERKAEMVIHWICCVQSAFLNHHS
jgi:deoxyadenosine/deoxycytidine kinase